MKKNKLLIIGGGMAGTKFSAELVSRTSEFSITILNQESYAAYNRIMLSPVLAGEKKFSDISLYDEQWYLDHDISVRNNIVAERIDANKKCVIAESGEQFYYDQLIIATGSSPFKAPIPGYDSEGVLTFRTKNDVDQMLALVEPKRLGSNQKKHCVVIGGGLLGLEAASALAKQGAKVSVINRGAHILDRQLNDKAAALLQRYFEKQHITFYLNANSSEITSDADHRVTGLRLENEQLIPADLVVMAIGVRPNKSIAERSGINCDKGIIVDAQMRTHVEDIYALGECVQFENNLFGLVAPAYEQANILANCLCASSEKDASFSFDIKPVATKLKVSGVDLFSAGDISSQAEYQYIEYEDYSNNIYKRLSIHENKIVGAILFGDVLDGAWYFDLINQHQDISKLRSKLLFGKAICMPSN